ncbi:MAG: D-glycero-beta-D-manno-heptose 1-phosphate adenylyltransferase [Acidobacteriota bacterium]
MNKELALPELLERLTGLRRQGKRIVFTNGCYDLLHPGHVHFLSQARQLGDALVVGVNSDRSVREIKGPARPILTQEERCQILSGLASVDFVVIFDEPTPLDLISALRPDVLVKGGDWGLHEIVGREQVEAGGGRVVTLPFLPGFSTSAIVQRVLDRYRDNA